jgi:hypothetical protein
MRIRIRILGIFFILDPGWEKFGSGIRKKYPGSATLVLASYGPETPSGTFSYRIPFTYFVKIKIKNCFYSLISSLLVYSTDHVVYYCAFVTSASFFCAGQHFKHRV